jgi:DHA2 family multidrug resistance protein-like MFS transporter
MRRMNDSPPAPPVTAPPIADGLPAAQRRWALAAVLISVALAAVDTSIANAALPTIAGDLRTSPAASIWVVNAYQLAVVACLLPLSSMGEIFGYRRICRFGLALFIAASLACALSWSLATLTLARVVQGLGAAGIMSVNVALIRFIFPANQLGRGVGLNALVVAVATAVGPTVASAILSVATWPWLFAINVPIGLIALALATRSLPATPRATHRFDWGSAVLNAGTFGLLIFGIGEAAHAVSLATTLGALGGALVLGTLLVRRQLGLSAPMLPVDLYRRPIFALSSLTSMCSFSAQGLAFVALPFYFQTVLGRTAVETGLLLTPWPVMTGLIAPIAGPMSDRFPPAILGGIGMAVLCAGLALMASLPAEPGTMGIVWRMMVCGAGFGFFQSPNLRAIMSAAPRARSGGASGIVATSRLVGQSTGAALVALCFGLSVHHGPELALALAAAFAGGAGIASFSRLLTTRPA